MKLKRSVAISESGFIFSPLSGDSYSTNQIGQEILTKIKNNISHKEIEEFIINNYNIDREKFRKDFEEFLSSLNYYGLIE